jgi:23S rRNA pseudouridine1911/1915/1917 synthase
VSTEAQLLTIEKEAEGSRLDSFLAAALREISRTRIQRAIEDGDVLVNERAVKPSYRLRAGDRVEVDLPEPPPTELLPEPIPLKIIYEDGDLVVIDKPAGLIVHPGAGAESGTLANALVYHFNELRNADFGSRDDARGDEGTAPAPPDNQQSETRIPQSNIRPGIVHRIDKETSGLLVVAKNDYAHERLSDQFRDRKVFKLYAALVYGHMSQERGEVDARIGRSPHNRTRMAVLKGGAGRTAHTLFEVAGRFREFTLLRVEIKTGRTHQIRVHLAHVGHPVVGDATYGQGRENSVRDPQSRRKIARLGRQFLHAAQLSFAHPRTGDVMEFESPLPRELVDFLTGLE